MKRIAEFQPEHEHEGITDYIEIFDYPNQPPHGIESIFYSTSTNNFLYYRKREGYKDSIQKVNGNLVIQETKYFPNSLKVSKEFVLLLLSKL